jgi:heme exporter protein A
MRPELRRDGFYSVLRSDNRLPMSEVLIEARNLARRFAEVNALTAVDLDVRAGEAIAVLGPNGAGKTTFLRLLATLLRPSTGSLKLFGKPLKDGGAQARRQIGFLSHSSFLYPDLTPIENLEFYAGAFRVRDHGQRIREVLNDVGLLGWRNRPVGTLSRGMEQRCAVARALLHRPTLLLLDEPFSGLDVDSTAMLSSILQREHARGVTLLVTTHDLPRALEACHRGIVLARGELRWDGTIAGIGVEALQETYTAVTRAP